MGVDLVYLASGSPRRRELLEQIGVPFRVLSLAIDESVAPAESPVDYVCRLAAAKASAGLTLGEAALHPGRPVLAADTAVVLDGEILGKPADRADGLRMLEALSGRTHEVWTAVALASAQGTAVCHNRSEVTFRSIGGAEALEYWATGEPCDKAGGYAIQGKGAVFIRDLRGSYSGVMGLPLYETAQLLRSAGVPRWRAPAPASG